MLIISMLVKSNVRRTLTQETENPGHLARRFHQIAVAIFHAEVEAVGSDLTPVQYAALAKIRTEPGLDQATLAGLVAQDRATICGVVDRLVEKGLVARTVNKEDRRARVLHVTAAGRRILAHIEPAVEATQSRLLSGLTEKEARELTRLLSKAIASVNELSRAPLIPA